MKNKQTYLMRASFAALIFVMLGYVIKFYPEVIKTFDTSIQNLIRNQLSASLTQIFKGITFIGNPSTQIATVFLLSLTLYLKRWYIESGFILLSGSLAALTITGFKYTYQRPRPSLEHLVHAGGYSFPSGHSLGPILILGSLIIIIGQRVQHKHIRLALQTLIGLTIFLIGFSRIYLGVHYPTDVIAGFTLGFGILSAVYPFYDQKRFEWRFQNKQA